ncbi:unnamed protein product [Closterium sp. NIES-53]
MAIIVPLPSPRSPLLLLLALLLLSSAHLPLRARAQQCSATTLCADNLCCSEWGWCGSTPDYCGPGCQSQCSPSSSSPPPPLTGSPPPSSGMNRMAYFVNWAGMDPSVVPAASLTHVFYAFAAIDASTYQVVPSNPAVDVTEGLYLRFNSALKDTNPAIKTLLSIGGYSAGTTAFVNAASSPSSRSAFIQSAIALARSYNFDGLDIDWEYPTGNAALFSALLTDFRAAIESEAASSGNPQLLLSAAVSAYEPTIAESYDVPTLNSALDFVNVMTYDLHGSWELITGMHTALEDLSNPQLSLKGAMAAWVSRGLAPSKAMLGLAMYGRTWTLASASSTGVGAAATGPGQPGSISQEAGVLFYREIDELVTTGGYTAMLDAPTSSMYAVNGDQWVGYDDPSTITTKVQFAKAQGYGGHGDHTTPAGVVTSRALPPPWRIRNPPARGAAAAALVRAPPPARARAASMLRQQALLQQVELLRLHCGLLRRRLQIPVLPATLNRPPPPASGSPTPSTGLKRMAYFGSWGNRAAIPAAKLTHVFYAFASINPTTYKVVSSNAAVEVDGGLYKLFNADLKRANPAVKTLLSIGGATAGSTVFSNAASSTATRSAFIQSAIALARAHNFDGLDLDWEFPSGKAASFSALLTDFRAAIESEAASSKKPKLLLTAAVAPDEKRIAESYNVPMLNRRLDFVNIMTYDFHGPSWEKTTGMHTALEDSSSKLSVRASMDAWVIRGLARSKAMVGLAGYGKTWTLAPGSSTGVGAAALGAGQAGSISKEAGTLFYKEINQMVTTGGYKAYYHTPSSCMYAVRGDQWVGYDDPSTITKKVQFAKTQGYGGWFLWEASQDANSALLSAAAAA